MVHVLAPGAIETLAVERMAARAWPAAEIHHLLGWQLRYTPGASSRRLNSVLPHGNAGSLDRQLAACGAFYHVHGLPLRLQVSPAAPSDLSARLARRGFILEAETDLLVASTREVLDFLPAPAAYIVSESPALTDSWFAQYAAFNLKPTDLPESMQAIFGHIGGPSRYVQVWDGSTPIAIGLGIREGDWVGLFCLATDAAYRRHGAATLVIRTLAEWARDHAVPYLYLQVLATNQTAQTLYRRLGFVDFYRYRFWSEPTEPTVQ